MIQFSTSLMFLGRRAEFKSSLFLLHYSFYNRKIDTVAKRGSMLEKFFTNKDKRKNWHFDIVPSKPKVRAFEKIHKPHRRRAVLNSLFISNITDVLSTEGVVPDAVKYGVEITGVQVSPCWKILNVFWQVPVSQYDSCDDIARQLNVAAPKIRAELISRNVLGKVPTIFFLRDATNARVAAFEKAMQSVSLEPRTESGVVIDDSFLGDMYSFRTPKGNEIKTGQTTTEEETKKESPEIPHKPLDMKCNVFGLDHELLMTKVIASKNKSRKPPEHTNVISPENLKSADDLFSNIPGVCFQPESSNDAKARNAILKAFQIERKKFMQEKRDKNNAVEHFNEDDFEDDYEIEDNYASEYGNDFIENETDSLYK